MREKSGQSVLLLGSFGESLVNFRGPLIRDLIPAGHRVIAGAPGISAKTRAELEAIGATVVETPMARTGLNPLSDIGYYFGLRRLMQRHHPHLLLTYTIKPNIWGAFAAAAEGVPSAAMVTGLGYAFTGSGGLRQKLVRYLATQLYRQATNRNRKVIFQNPDDRDDFIKAGCLADPQKAGMVNGSGVDIKHYGLAPLPRQPVFLMISRLLGNKGVREYAQAAVATKKQLPQCRFLLVGYMDEGPDGIASNELDAWCNAGLEYLGAMDDVRPAIASASVYVLPSYREGTPRSVLEAMSMGRAIITSDAPGCRETTVNGENGWLVAVKDSEGLARRMSELAQSPRLRAAMGKTSREIAVNKYDTSAVNRSLMQQLGLLG